MKLRSIILSALLVLCTGSVAYAGTVTLEWDKNIEPDLAGYRIHYGTTPGTYTEHVDVGNVTRHTLMVPDGPHYFVATAYDVSGNESEYSNMVDNQAPAAPKNLLVKGLDQIISGLQDVRQYLASQP